MKFFPTAILAGFIVFLTFSCNSTEPANKYPDMVADMEPVSIGTIDAQFDKLLSSDLNKLPIKVVFYPRYNVVDLEFKLDFITYHQFWDAQARQQFIAGVENYKNDFTERKLVNRSTRTRSVYGRVKGYLEWQSFQLAQTYMAHPDILLGYRFKKDSPFFCTLMLAAVEDVQQGASSRVESQQIAMYFTRAQADELVEFFDHDYLMGLIGGDAAGQEEPVPADDYQEPEAD